MTRDFSSHVRRAFGRSRRAIPTCILACLAFVVAASGRPAAQPTSEVRALWVTRSSLTSPQAIQAMVRSAAASGFNTLLVQVRGRGDAYYASTLEPRAELLDAQPAGFDPLATTLTLAHAQGLRVHAWVNVNLVSSGADLPNARTHLVYQHPEWLMVPRALAFELGRLDPRSPDYVGRLARWTRGKSTEIEGLYASPIHPGAVDRLAAVVDQLVARYAIDGLHLDYIRYPSATFDYSRGALRAFRASIEAELTLAERRRFSSTDLTALVGLTDARPERWADFRRSRLNTLAMRLRTVAKEHRPNLVVSAAVYPDPAEAAANRLQDWRTWLESRWMDVICPMAYAPDAATFASQIAFVRQVAGTRPVWAGIGAYRLSSLQTIENIQTARRLGADGVILFSYDSLTRSGVTADRLSSIGRAAFSAAP